MAAQYAASRGNTRRSVASAASAAASRQSSEDAHIVGGEGWCPLSGMVAASLGSLCLARLRNKVGSRRPRPSLFRSAACVEPARGIGAAGPLIPMDMRGGWLSALGTCIVCVLRSHRPCGALDSRRGLSTITAAALESSLCWPVGLLARGDVFDGRPGVGCVSGCAAIHKPRAKSYRRARCMPSSGVTPFIMLGGMAHTCLLRSAQRLDDVEQPTAQAHARPKSATHDVRPVARSRAQIGPLRPPMTKHIAR